MTSEVYNSFHVHADFVWVILLAHGGVIVLHTTPSMFA